MTPIIHFAIIHIITMSLFFLFLFDFIVILVSPDADALCRSERFAQVIYL